MNGEIQIWLIGAAVLVVASAFFLWRRTRKRSPFQARLAILFFLFVIIPIIPLTFFASHLLTQSTKMLMLPGVENALVESLDILRHQLNRRGRQFLEEHQNIQNLSQAELRQANMCYAGHIVQQDTQNVVLHFQTIAPGKLDQTKLYQDIDFSSLEDRRSIGYMGQIDSIRVFESYYTLSDSSLIFVGFALPPEVVAAAENISMAHRQYSSINLLHETVVDEGMIGIAALVFIIFLALVSLALSRLVASGISEPIKELSSGMKKIGAGDLSYRVNAKAKDEIAFLISSFNAMAQDLKVSRENLQRAERAAAWRDIARQISHEIKNPLTPIEFSLYRLQASLPADALENQDLQEAMRIIREEISSIRRITSEFSQFARMPLMDLKPRSIGDIVTQSVQLFRHQQNDIDIQYDIDENLPKVQLDEEHFRRVIHNIVKNAIEASEVNTCVHVQVSKGGQGKQGVVVFVTDQGCGMDDETRRKIFEPYFTNKKDGSGIGLFLVHKIISDHGGTIDVKSEPGKGTVFSIML